MCLAGHVPVTSEAWAGRVALGTTVCAFIVYAPLCINAFTFSISAASMASGRKPSKVTMKTREMGWGGIGAWVGEGVSGAGGIGLGVRVAVGMGGVAVGVGEEAEAGTQP